MDTSIVAAIYRNNPSKIIILPFIKTVQMIDATIMGPKGIVPVSFLLFLEELKISSLLTIQPNPKTVKYMQIALSKNTAGAVHIGTAFRCANKVGGKDIDAETKNLASPGPQKFSIYKSTPITMATPKTVKNNLYPIAFS